MDRVALDSRRAVEHVPLPWWQGDRRRVLGVRRAVFEAQISGHDMRAEHVRMPGPPHVSVITLWV
jgi:hypothetical protein